MPVKQKFWGPLLLIGILAVPALAKEIPYDRYASPPSGLKPASSFSAGQFLVYSFELIRWPIDRSLVYIEKNHLYDKVYWIYQEMKKQGITLRFLKGAGFQDGFGGGFLVDFMKIARLKETLPQLSVDGSAAWTTDKITLYKADILQKMADTGLRAGGSFRYESRGEEHFYGIGPHTSLGDGTSFKSERTTLATLLGYSFFKTWDLEGKFAYQNVNITNGEDGGRGIIDDIFVATGRQRVPGLAGDQILSWGLDLKHDTRDELEIPSQGGYEKFHFSYQKGIENDTGYLKYRADVAHFFKLFSERRVIALRGLGEINEALGERQVPFFDMARLGGYGTHPRLGDVHRGFKRDRFYDNDLFLLNLEYRWTIWEYRHWRMDSVLFWDEGQVFNRVHHFKFRDFRDSYGFGFRVVRMKEVVFTFEVARSDEGTEFYAGTAAPF